MTTPSLTAKNDRVDWSRYALDYDLLTALNPAYQDILRRITSFAARWPLNDGDTIVELGAGTGNVSTLLAGIYPQCMIIHADADASMNAIASNKAKRLGLANLQIQEADASALLFGDGSLSAVFCIHSLYTITNPKAVIASAVKWLKGGGAFVACDFGRTMNLADWRRYMLWQLVAQFGPLNALRTFVKGGQAVTQNRMIAAEQRSGRYWLHTPEEFRHAFESQGMVVEEADVCFRGYSDFVVCRKPMRETLGASIQAGAGPPVCGGLARDA